MAKLKAEAAGKTSASKILADYGNHSFMTAYRTGDGEAEVHEKTVDHFVVQVGEAQLQVGGTVVEPKTTGPGEIRGKAIQGGEIINMKPGDIIHIPANTPHQVLIKKGEFLYSVIKVKQ
jgi:mannose-6-phosphate isomerase-like protein (cupin superfamily)